MTDSERGVLDIARVYAREWDNGNLCHPELERILICGSAGLGLHDIDLGAGPPCVRCDGQDQDIAVRS